MAGKQEETEAVFVPFTWVWHFFWSMFFMWFISCLIHIGWVRSHGLEPTQHMEELIAYYVDKTGGAPLAETVVNKTYWVVEAIIKLPPAQSAQEGDIQAAGAIRRGIWAGYRPDLQVIGYGTVLFALKVGLFLVSALLFGLLLIAAGIDGLVERAIRRACGGHESSAIYHRAKKYGLRLLPPFAAMIFFCSPVPFDPAWIFVPVAVSSAVLLRYQATYYKKYL